LDDKFLRWAYQANVIKTFARAKRPTNEKDPSKFDRLVMYP